MHIMTPLKSTVKYESQNLLANNDSLEIITVKFEHCSSIWIRMGNTRNISHFTQLLPDFAVHSSNMWKWHILVILVLIFFVIKIPLKKNSQDEDILIYLLILVLLIPNINLNYWILRNSSIFLEEASLLTKS